MTKDEDFKAGDVVKWQEGSTWHRFDVWGKVTAVTAAGTLTVKRLDHNKEAEVIRKGEYWYKCEMVTDLEIRVRRWRNAIPETKRIDVRLGLSPYRDNETSLSISRAKLSVELLDEVEAELRQVRGWLNARPVS